MPLKHTGGDHLVGRSLSWIARLDIIDDHAPWPPIRVQLSNYPCSDVESHDDPGLFSRGPKGLPIRLVDVVLPLRQLNRQSHDLEPQASAALELCDGIVDREHGETGRREEPGRAFHDGIAHPVVGEPGTRLVELGVPYEPRPHAEGGGHNLRPNSLLVQIGETDL